MMMIMLKLARLQTAGGVNRLTAAVQCSGRYGGGGIGVGVVTARSLLGEATHSVEVNVWTCISDCS